MQLFPIASWKPRVVQAGLIAEYRFDEQGGAQSLVDYSPNALHGTNGSGSSSDAADPGIVCNPPHYVFHGGSGDAQRISLPDMSSYLSTAITVQVCFRPDLAEATRGVVKILNHGAAPYGTANIYLAATNSLRYLLGWSDNTFTVITIQGITTGTWYDVAVTYNGSQGISYVNGAQVTSQTHGKTLKSASQASYIGANSTTSEFFGGAICAMQVYNRALSATEIAQNSAINRARIPLGANVNNAAATNAASALTIPTYEASGEATHPDVWDFGTTWNGYRYWMGMTPYPTANANVENPSIVASNDKSTWVVPAGLTNPIDPQPGGVGQHNADTDLVYDGTYLYCSWESTDHNLCSLRSSDGVTWGNLQEDIYPSKEFDVSQAMVLKDGVYHMWGVDSTTYSLRYARASGPQGPFTYFGQCRYVVPQLSTTTWQPWHPNVVWNSQYSEFHMVLCVIVNGTYKLWFGASPDGINWRFGKSALLSPSASGWDNSRIYRSSIVWDSVNSRYDLWYGGVSSGNVWKIGLTTITGM